MIIQHSRDLQTRSIISSSSVRVTSSVVYSHQSHNSTRREVATRTDNAFVLIVHSRSIENDFTFALTVQGLCCAHGRKFVRN